MDVTVQAFCMSGTMEGVVRVAYQADQRRAFSAWACDTVAMTLAELLFSTTACAMRGPEYPGQSKGSRPRPEPDASTLQ